jgi:hypothetical protein
MQPVASVLISSFGSQKASWEVLRNCLQAIAAQDVVGQVEVVLVEMAGLKGDVPDDIRDIVPLVQTVSCYSTDPWAGKTAGARHASAPIVVFLDADCAPGSGWLRSMLELLRFFPEVAAVRGPVEKQNSSWRRLLIPARRAAGPVWNTAENNIAFRREAYLDCPFPEGMGVEAVSLQTAALHRAHYVLWAEPAMQVVRVRSRKPPMVSVRIRYSRAASASGTLPWISRFVRP